MVKRIIISLVVLAIVGYFGWWAYKNWRSGQASATGEVFSREPIAASVTRSGEISTPSVQSPGNSNSKNTFALPASDSQAPNAPEGQRFTGSGKFQVYRQGNITYRVNTETGESCVLFATPDEWRKAVVYNHSCHTS